MSSYSTHQLYAWHPVPVMPKIQSNSACVSVLLAPYISSHFLLRNAWFSSLPKLLVLSGCTSLSLDSKALIKGLYYLCLHHSSFHQNLPLWWSTIKIHSHNKKHLKNQLTWCNVSYDNHTCYAIWNGHLHGSPMWSCSAHVFSPASSLHMILLTSLMFVLIRIWMCCQNYLPSALIPTVFTTHPSLQPSEASLHPSHFCGGVPAFTSTWSNFSILC